MIFLKKAEGGDGVRHRAYLESARRRDRWRHALSLLGEGRGLRYILSLLEKAEGGRGWESYLESLEEVGGGKDML